ncbi:MAG: metal ABC transporter permease [Alkalinema sp. CAN_BIN05]|nr:metal ABC transporter permease [Alkalinema sp. CAN_BIN05]
MWSMLIEPLQSEFIRNAIGVSMIIGVLCPVVGTYLIVQRMALMGDVMAHCVLPGLSIAAFLGVDRSIGAFITSMLGSFFVSWVRSQSRVKVDSAMALTFSTFFAIGVTLITLLKNKLDLDRFLFGDILTVTLNDIYATAAIAMLVLAAIYLFYKELLYYTFDATGAEAVGLPIKWLHLGMMTGITLTIITSMQVVGVLLVIALLIGPALTAYLVTQELHHMMFLGSGIGIMSSLVGIYLSYYLNLPSGPAIVLVSSSLFMLTFLFTTRSTFFKRPKNAN